MERRAAVPFLPPLALAKFPEESARAGASSTAKAPGVPVFRQRGRSSIICNVVNRLELDKRSALSQVLRDAREAKGWSQEEAAEHATSALRIALSGPEGAAASRKEKEAWDRIEITRHHVLTLENCPAAPLATVERRARLLGLTLALGVDRGEMNRLSGGL